MQAADEHAGLCGSSLHVWYKALFQDLLQQWSSHSSSVLALHKSRQGPLRQEGAEAALAQLKQCGKAFSSLLTLNKVHLKRIQVRPLLFFVGFMKIVDLGRERGQGFRGDLHHSQQNANTGNRLVLCSGSPLMSAQYMLMAVDCWYV